MTRLEKKGSALSRIGLALALFSGLILGVSGFASAASDDSSAAYLMGYFLRDTAGGDDVITLINGNGEAPRSNMRPGAVSPDDFVDICANVYLFDTNQDEQGCCALTITAGGMGRIPVNELIAGLTPGSGSGATVPLTGTLKIVATNLKTSPVFTGTAFVNSPTGACNASAASGEFLISDADDAGTTFGTEDSFHGSITHTYTGVTGLSAAVFTMEVPLTKTHEPVQDLDNLASSCTPAPSVDCCKLAGMITTPGGTQNCVED